MFELIIFIVVLRIVFLFNSSIVQFHNCARNAVVTFTDTVRLQLYVFMLTHTYTKTL